MELQHPTSAPSHSVCLHTRRARPRSPVMFARQSPEVKPVGGIIIGQQRTQPRTPSSPSTSPSPLCANAFRCTAQLRQGVATCRSCNYGASASHGRASDFGKDGATPFSTVFCALPHSESPICRNWTGPRPLQPSDSDTPGPAGPSAGPCRDVRPGRPSDTRGALSVTAGGGGRFLPGVYWK